MVWIKTELPERWHSKLRAYSEKQDVNMVEAACALIQRGIVAYEADKGEL